MQRVELYYFYSDLFCPFCGQQTIGEGVTSPCQHTIYIATDYGLDHCSERINKEALEAEGDQEGFDSATDELECEECLKFAMYSGTFGVYVGYAIPSDE